MEIRVARTVKAKEFIDFMDTVSPNGLDLPRTFMTLFRAPVPTEQKQPRFFVPGFVSLVKPNMSRQESENLIQTGREVSLLRHSTQPNRVAWYVQFIVCPLLHRLIS